LHEGDGVCNDGIAPVATHVMTQQHAHTTMLAGVVNGEAGTLWYVVVNVVVRSGKRGGRYVLIGTSSNTLQRCLWLRQAWSHLF